MLKWLVWIAAVPVVAGLLVYGIGALLPSNHTARSEAKVDAPLSRVAALVREVERHPEWRASVTAVEVIERREGGLRYVERSGSDSITFEFAEEKPEHLFRSTIADRALPFGGAWTIALSPEGQGTRVRIEERGSVGNPIYRFFSTLVFGHEATMKAYLADLQRAATR